MVGRRKLSDHSLNCSFNAIYRDWCAIYTLISMNYIWPKVPNFGTCLQLNCSNFRLKLCERPLSYQHCQRKWVWRGLGRVRSEQMFLETITKHLGLTLVFMWNSGIQEKFNNLFFKSFLLVLTKFLFWQDDWALCYNSRKIKHFP